MILKDTFFEYDVQNENGRIYTKDVVVKMIEQFNARPVGMFGELHHTDITNVVSLKNASHIVTELHLNEEKSTLDGTIEILDTPTGNTIKHLMEKGMKWNDGFKLSTSKSLGNSTIPQNKFQLFK